jgi:hypothetical protein
MSSGAKAWSNWLTSVHNVPATSPISVEATRTDWLITLQHSVVAATSAVTAAVRWLVDATGRVGLVISRMAALCRPEAVIGEP